MKIYDVLIIGGGVAGMSAAVYAKRRGKDVAIIEKLSLGGQVAFLNKIENFPSQVSIDGFSLCQMFVQQFKNLQIEKISDEILEVDFNGENKTLIGKKASYYAKSVIIATGLSNVELKKNENQYLGMGVSYCAVCDGNFYKNKEVCVASKNGSGIKSALTLAEVCSCVTVLDSGDMSRYASANKNEKIKIVSNVDIDRIEGGEKVEEIVLKTGTKQEKLKTEALFVDLGKKPKTELFEKKLKLDSQGYIVTNEKMQTSVENVFAVGDVRNGFLKQIITACSDGAVAGQLCWKSCNHKML